MLKGLNIKVKLNFISSGQIRMARTYLRWTIDDLSKKTDIP